jgi:hypothetical protein
LYENAPKSRRSGDWYDALAGLACDCADVPASAEAQVLRALRDHLLHAPWIHSLAGVNLPDAAEFETLLSAGAGESAALRLIGEDAGYMLSRGPGGMCLASVILPGRTEEASCGGESFGLALAGALALALADSPAMPSDNRDAESRPALRLN